MKKATIAALLACSAGCALAQDKPAPVEVAVPHWYVGIGAAQTIYAVEEDSAVKAPGATSSSLNQGTNQTGYRFFAGYRLHRNLAIEGALADYGKFTDTREVSAPVSGSVIAQTRIRAATLDLVGIWPFDNGFSFLGKLGGAVVASQTDYRTEGAYVFPAGTRTSVKNTEVVAHYGVGVGYAVTERVTLKMEYEVARKAGEEIEGDLKALFFSVQYRF